jgi:hypothetical protein
MIKLLEEDIGENYVQVHMGLQSKYQQSHSKNQPTHFTMTLGENGFDKVKYYRINLDTQ